jgi:hypothetical protein
VDKAFDWGTPLAVRAATTDDIAREYERHVPEGLSRVRYAAVAAAVNAVAVPAQCAIVAAQHIGLGARYFTKMRAARARVERDLAEAARGSLDAPRLP